MATHLQGAVVLLALFVVSSTADTCSYGRVPSVCHPGCPATCETIDSPGTTCSESCISGCFCPDGRVQFDDDICVESSQCSLLDGLDAEIPATDQCSQYGTCEECITSDPDCQWCPYPPTEESVKGSRCRNGTLNPVCPEMVNNPQPSVNVTGNKSFDDDIQIQPQKLKLQLRVGKTEQFTVQFRAAENYPLDVYFLLDVTGSFARDFRSTVVPLATDLVQALSDISSRYAAGFGSFGDKRAFPYALTNDSPDAYFSNAISGSRCSNERFVLQPENCNPTISFRHTDPLRTVETEELMNILGNISIHLNLDTLEGGLDGLMQALTCRDIIGWREPSLRMLLYMSNAPFHLAGDGKVGAAFRPNPGECHLEAREENGTMFYEYRKDTFYDYPSVYQLREAIRSSQTNVVFAVTTREKPLYELLNAELGLGSSVQVIELLSDSANIIPVIQSSYSGITQEIRLSPDIDYPELEFGFTPGGECNLTDDLQGCSGVEFGDTISFTINVTMTSCLENTTVVRLQSSAFGSVELEIEPLCQCPCTSDPVLDASVCGGNGTLVCGECICNEGRSGDRCQCVGDETPVCGPSEDNQCSGRGRGRCDCGTCQCYIQDGLLSEYNISKPYFGDYCECGNLTSCGGPVEGGTLEFCSGRGTCNCTTDTCNCTERDPLTNRLYFGDRCECSHEQCYNDMFPSRVCVYTGALSGIDDAECGCDGCLCNSDAESVDGTCQQRIQDRCSTYEECARCEKGLQSSDTDCDQLQEEQGCNTTLYTNDTAPSTHTEECSFKDSDDCTHRFYLSLPFTTVLVDDDKECPSDGRLTPLAWIIPVSVIGGLLLLGLLILLIVLLVMWILDRFEFQKFQKNLGDPNWVPQENPLYISPQQQYTNIAYKRSRRRQ